MSIRINHRVSRSASMSMPLWLALVVYPCMWMTQFAILIFVWTIKLCILFYVYLAKGTVLTYRWTKGLRTR